MVFGNLTQLPEIWAIQNKNNNYNNNHYDNNVSVKDEQQCSSDSRAKHVLHASAVSTV